MNRKAEFGKRLVSRYIEYWNGAANEIKEGIRLNELSLNTLVSAPISKYGDCVTGYNELNTVERFAYRRDELRRKIASAKQKLENMTNERRLVIAAVNSLPDKQRAIIKARAVDRVSWDEAGRRVGRSARWVRSEINKAYEKVVDMYAILKLKRGVAND